MEEEYILRRLLGNYLCPHNVEAILFVYILHTVQAIREVFREIKRTIRSQKIDTYNTILAFAHWVGREVYACEVGSDNAAVVAEYE